MRSVCSPSRASKAVRGRRSALAVVGALIAVLLSGCLNYSADVTVSHDDQVSGTVILTRKTTPLGGVEVLPSPAPLPSNAPGSNAPNKVEFPKPVSNTDSIVVTPYSDGTNVGYKIEYKRATFKEAAAFTPLGDRGGALVFTRDGDTVQFTASFDLTFDAGTEAQKALLAKNVSATVKIDLPGTISDSNGTVAGNAVTWTVEPLKANDLAATYTSAAPAAPSASKAAAAASASDKGVSTTTWVIIGVVVLGLLIIGAVTFGLLRRRRSKDAGQSAASGPAPSSVPAMAVASQFADPAPVPQSFGPSLPQRSVPQQSAPPPAEPPSEQSDDQPRDENPNERTTTYAVAEQKRQERQPAPESPSDEASAMITGTPPASAPSHRGGWPPPRPKWKQEP